MVENVMSTVDYGESKEIVISDLEATIKTESLVNNNEESNDEI